MKRKSLSVAVAASAMLAMVSVQAIDWRPSTWFENQARTQSAAPAADMNQLAAANMPAVAAAPIAPMTAPNYRGIVEQFGPAVVGITTQGTTQASLRGGEDGLPDDPFFRFFFRGFPGQGAQMPRAEVPVRGQGSGFIIARDGLILTNAHVIKDANEVMVKLSDRREYKAKVLGSDQGTDVAVLKIDAKDLPVVRLGNPTQLGVGDYVLAIGSPFGFEQSATAGIVSAKSRSLPGDAYVPFIQTDVAVNPGNSGGPLFDAQGNVVGINSQIYSRTGGYQGVSFAIPIDVALRVKDQIVSSGKVVHARLGVSIQELNQALAESFKLKRPDGALVSSVAPGSPAAKAGLKAGDVVLSYNGEPIERSGDLPAKVGMGMPGDKAVLEVWRDGKRVSVPAVLGTANEIAAAADANSGDAAEGRLGLALRPLTAQEQQAQGVAGGLLVAQAAGTAARAGILPGDVILAVNGTQVRTVQQLQAIASGQNKSLAFLVLREGARIFIPIRVG